MNYLKSSVAAAAATIALAGAASADTSVCLITKDATNPFFVKMAQGAFAKAADLGVELRSYAGKFDGDHETQVSAIETCVAAGAGGILLVASTPRRSPLRFRVPATQVLLFSRSTLRWIQLTLQT